MSGAVKLTKNVDIDKYRYSGYGIGFDRRESFSSPGSGFGQNVIIFEPDMSSSVHVDNKGKDILILGSGPTQGLNFQKKWIQKECIQLTLLWQEQNLFELALQWSKQLLIC